MLWPRCTGCRCSRCILPVPCCVHCTHQDNAWLTGAHNVHDTGHAKLFRWCGRLRRRGRKSPAVILCLQHGRVSVTVRVRVRVSIGQVLGLGLATDVRLLHPHLNYVITCAPMDVGMPSCFLLPWGLSPALPALLSSLEDNSTMEPWKCRPN